MSCILAFALQQSLLSPVSPESLLSLESLLSPESLMSQFNSNFYPTEERVAHSYVQATGLVYILCNSADSMDS